MTKKYTQWKGDFLKYDKAQQYTQGSGVEKWKREKNFFLWGGEGCAKYEQAACRRNE